MCVPIYCFCSGYAHYLLQDKEKAKYIQKMPKRLLHFLCNFWIVLAIFSGLGLLFDDSGRLPGSITDFLGNVFLVDLSYNGAWWFVLTYVIFVVLSPFIYRIVNKIPAVPLLFLSGATYFVSYLFRFVIVIDFENAVFSWIWTQAILLGTSQFAYMLGMIFRKYSWIASMRKCLRGENDVCEDAPAKEFGGGQIVCVLLPILLFLLHCAEPSLIIAPITGLGTIVCFWVIRKPRWMEDSFLFFGKHSTNIWLAHMFFIVFFSKTLCLL